jgi:hypothetical protein
MELLISLHGEDHTDKHARDQDDGDAAYADFVHALHNDRAARESSAQPAEHRRGEQRKVADRLDELDYELSERVND